MCIRDRAQGASSCPSGAPVVPSAVFTVDTNGQPLGIGNAAVIKLFADAGVAITWMPPSSPVMIIADTEDYGGFGMQADPIAKALGFHNLIKQGNGYPVAYMLTFAKPCLLYTSRCV